MLVFVSALGFSSGVWSKQCELRKIDQYTFEVDFPDGRTIGIYGWHHPGNGDFAYSLELYGDSIDRSCSNVEIALKGFLEDNKNILNHAKRVYTKLSQSGKFQEIATERAAQEQKEVNTLYQKIITGAQKYMERCPHLKDKINESLLIVPGPDAMYSYARLKKPLLAVENGKLLTEAEKRMPVWAASNNHLYSQLSERTLQLLKKQERMGFEITPEYIKEVVRSEKDPDLRRYLAEYLEYNAFLLSQVPERNEYMLKSMLARPHSVALVVGYHHNLDFEKQVLKECQRQQQFQDQRRSVFEAKTAE